jgi:hypothetical protein
MAKARKKTVTSKNTKPKLAPIESQFRKVFAQLNGRRAFGCFTTISHPYLNKAVHIPLVSDYDKLYQAMIMDKIKQTTEENLSDELCDYYGRAIDDFNDGDSKNVADFISEHGRMVSNYTFPIMLLNKDCLELELENDDSRFFRYVLEYSVNEDEQMECDIYCSIYGDKNNFIAEVSKILGTKANVALMKSSGFDNEFKTI